MPLFVVLFVEHEADAVAHAWVKGCRRLSRLPTTCVPQLQLNSTCVPRTPLLSAFLTQAPLVPNYTVSWDRIKSTVEPIWAIEIS